MKNRKSFTLLEVLIIIFISSLVFIAILEIHLAGQKLYSLGENRAEILQNGRIILERISRELRQAKEIVTPLPQVDNNPDFPPPSEIEFQDGHTPSPYQYLGADYYYIKYYFSSSTREIKRQYLVYCLDDCSNCQNYYKWNERIQQEGQILSPHACILEDKVIGEYVNNIKFWGKTLINIEIELSKFKENIELETSIFARNL